MSPARRAKGHAYNPRKLWTVVIIVLAIVLLAAGLANRRTNLEPSPTPQTPAPTWTSYVPVPSQECLAANEAAEDVITTSGYLHRADLVVASLAAKGQYDRAGQKIKDAEKANAAYGKAVARFRALAKKCEE